MGYWDPLPGPQCLVQYFVNSEGSDSYQCSHELSKVYACPFMVDVSKDSALLDKQFANGKINQRSLHNAP